MADAITLDKLLDELNQIAQLDVVKLAERESLGELNFGDIRNFPTEQYAMPDSFAPFR